MKIQLNQKALSVNRAWQGRRFKTKEYKSYEKELLLKLPNSKNDFKGNLRLDIVFGYSNTLNDIDNGLKPLLDVLQRKYDFNDRDVYELNVKKKIVKKGKEFIKINILAI